MRNLPIGRVWSDTHETAPTKEAADVDAPDGPLPVVSAVSRTQGSIPKISADVYCKYCGSECRKLFNGYVCLNSDQPTSWFVHDPESCSECGSPGSELVQLADDTWNSLCPDCLSAVNT